MALKKPWITRPGRWECAQDLGLAQAGKGVLPQQAKALPLSYSLLPAGLGSSANFYPWAKRGGRSFPVVGKGLSCLSQQGSKAASIRL